MERGFDLRDRRGEKEAILLAGSKLGHIHLNGNDWGIPGTGHLDWDGIFEALGEIRYEGYSSWSARSNRAVRTSGAAWRRTIGVWRRKAFGFSRKKERRSSVIRRVKGDTDRIGAIEARNTKFVCGIARPGNRRPDRRYIVPPKLGNDAGLLEGWLWEEGRPSAARPLSAV